ncbi:probable flavin-containing monoamine oxidase A [Aplysia californica]|uniref:Amine oxidase n=1 Tax=Aplysia californica TaxID=6500 RepID=A0ABM0JNC3_APLCA|nr:probable flavin-containing monoamine oxidase A [Aplysia californica]XP_035825486.1 probable flavin-containing monoamine oxidase A [Aplysia californica]
MFRGKDKVADVHVVIVGAGISGLTAAYKLKMKDPTLKIAVLEGKDRVGGRTETVPLVAYTGSDSWDLGGQWVGRCQVHVTKLLKELQLKTYPQYIAGKKLMQLGQGKVHSYTSTIPRLSILELLDLYLFMSKIEYYQKQLLVEDPYSHPKAVQWDAMSAAAFLDRTLYTSAARGTVAAAMRCVLGCELSQVSFLYYLLYIRMAGGITQLIEATENTAQESRICGGAQQIAVRLSQHIGEESVHLGDAAAYIQQENSKFVEVWTKGGMKFCAEYVILATPPKALEHITFNPPLSSEKVDFIKRMPMGSMIKVIVTFEKAFWRASNMSGEVVTDGGISRVHGCARRPLCITYDGTSESGCPALIGFVGGQPAVEWGKKTAKVRQKAILDHFAFFFGEEVYSFLDYVEKDWNTEPYSWGGPVSFVSPGGMQNFCHAIQHPEGRLHFAGTETATAWSGYMSGAVEAGERAALEVIYKLRPKSLNPEEIVLSKSSLHREKKESHEAVKRNMYGRAVNVVGAAVITCGVATVAVYFMNKYTQWNVKLPFLS